MTMTKFRLTRRQFIGNSIGLATVTTLPWYAYNRYLKPKPPIINIHRPGMELGHHIRDFGKVPPPQSTIDCDLIILGSGAAALSAAWKLKREGQNNFILLEGPEPNGNNAGGVNKELTYPTCAHYLALPSADSRHIREMLADIGVLQGDPYADEPQYDEMVVVHAQEERLLKGDTWQDAMLPEQNENSQRFFALIEQLSHSKGSDNKPLFAIPRVLSSEDTEWTKLDHITFAQWLKENNYTSPSLLWYLNYCCRDDYGQGIDRVSAWAGLHYYACRTGRAKNVEKGAVLTWPDGLASLSNKLRDFIGFERQSALAPAPTDKPVVMSGTAFKVTEQVDKVELLIGTVENGRFHTIQVNAKKVISTMPLFVAARVITNIQNYGFDPKVHMPVYAPWMVSNFIFNQYPQEQTGTGLAWDNVVYEGKGLGYVVSTHQLIRAAKPERTAFTAYYALNEDEPETMRKWLAIAEEAELVNKAASDLKLAYPKDLWRHLQQIDITLRAHAMPAPTPGYLSNAGTKALQQHSSRILFAHADLSGYSVFEESAWWGYQAALKYLK